MTGSVVQPRRRLPPPPAVEHPKKLLSLAAGFGANSSGGLRLELEQWNKSDWIIGASAGLTGRSLDVYDYNANDYYIANVTDFTLAMTLGRIGRWGDWYLRGNAGAGIMMSSMTLDHYKNQTYATTSGSGSEASAYIEAGHYIGHSIGSSKVWVIEAGPVLWYYKQDWYLSDSYMTMYRDARNTLVKKG